MTTYLAPLIVANEPYGAAQGWVVQSATNTLAYTDTTAKKLFTLQRPYKIIEVYTDVLTVFNDSGTDLVNIGTLASASALTSAADVSSVGRKLGSAGGATQLGNFTDLTDAAPVDIYGTYTGQNANATTGAARVTITYLVPIADAP